MPTPFSHLVMLERLRQDETLPHPIQRLLTSNAPAYTLGSIAPDARVPAPDSRYATHFYTYSKPMEEAPWRAMLKAHPQLIAPTDDEQRAFVAGYVAHLAMDEVWSREMLGPQFALADWGKDLQYRFFILQDLLVFMDERDEKQISPTLLALLQQAQAGAIKVMRECKACLAKPSNGKASLALLPKPKSSLVMCINFHRTRRKP